MWRTILLFLTLSALPAIGSCDTLQFTVNASDIGPAIQGPGSVNLFSSAINGTVLAGQTLSLNLVFSSDVLSRLYLVDPGGFGLGLTIDTNAGTFPGFVGPTTGYLLDAGGKQLGATQVAGSSDGCCPGELSMGLVSFTSSGLGGAEIMDISGVHFDTSLPNNGFVVTGAELTFSLNSPYDGVQFGTARELPEPSTLALALAGALATALAAVRWRK